MTWQTDVSHLTNMIPNAWFILLAPILSPCRERERVARLIFATTRFFRYCLCTIFKVRFLLLIFLSSKYLFYLSLSPFTSSFPSFPSTSVLRRRINVNIFFVNSYKLFLSKTICSLIATSPRAHIACPLITKSYEMASRARVT